MLIGSPIFTHAYIILSTTIGQVILRICRLTSLVGHFRMSSNPNEPFHFLCVDAYSGVDKICHLDTFLPSSFRHPKICYGHVGSTSPHRNFGAAGEGGDRHKSGAWRRRKSKTEAEECKQGRRGDRLSIQWDGMGWDGNEYVDGTHSSYRPCGQQMICIIVWNHTV